MAEKKQKDSSEHPLNSPNGEKQRVKKSSKKPRPQSSKKPRPLGMQAKDPLRGSAGSAAGGGSDESSLGDAGERLFLPMIPIDDSVILPGTTFVSEFSSTEARAALKAVEAAEQKVVVLVPRIEGQFTSIGVLALISDEVMQLPGEQQGIAVHAYARALLGHADASSGVLRVACTKIIDPDIESMSAEQAEEINSAAQTLRALFEGIIESTGNLGLLQILSSAEQPGDLADLAGFSPDLTLEQRVDLLNAVALTKRLELATEHVRRALEQINIRQEIRAGVSENIGRQHREFLLRRQLEEIRRELGELSGEAIEGDDYLGRIQESAMPEEARRECEREASRLDAVGQSPESSMIRNYLDWMLSLPWGVRSDNQPDAARAEAILEKEHAGLKEVKRRIVEYLAVLRLREERGIDERRGGVILCLVGPPGVGKTSLGESIAHALGRKFVRMALGGVRDEAEIRGHRRTYIGAMPGRIVRALRDSGAMNPVILLDEVDKLGADWRGDPASALLEVLDPAQNHSFRDNYLDTPIDLSDVLFIATANQVEQIPRALYDRLEVIELDGYTEDEKLEIATRYLLPRQERHNGILEGEVELSTPTITQLIRSYTREAGVRELERQIGGLLRRAAMEIAAGRGERPLVIDETRLVEWLGKERFVDEVAERVGQPGVATGLAVTAVGGDILFIEASASEGTKTLSLTGQLGEVMRESASIAYSYAAANRQQLGIPPGALDKRTIHIHVPAGAVPKDGPSAGIAMASALVSLLTQRPVRAEVAMTGEITLRGRVLAVGGIKQKLLAAARAGIREVIIPERNLRDLKDVPEDVLQQLEIHPVTTLEQALEIALSPSSAGAIFD